MQVGREVVQDVLAVLGAAIVAAGLYAWEPAVSVAWLGGLLMLVAVRLR